MRILLTAILAVTLAPSFAHAGGADWPIADYPRFWVLGEGATHFSTDYGYLYTTKNYDNLGNVYQPAGERYVAEQKMRFHLGHGFTPRVSVFAQADLRGVFMRNAIGSPVPDDENYGFGDAFLGLRWLIYRSKNPNRLYPTEWAPDSLSLVAEGTWKFATYDQTKIGRPPLGDQSSDVTGLFRIVWYLNEWLGLSIGGGFTHRTAKYSPEIPWSLRADFAFLENQRFRFWGEFHGSQSTARTGSVYAPTQPDIIPTGSLLYKSREPNIRIFTAGAGFLFLRNLEAVLAGNITASGQLTDKAMGINLGLVWRPYQVPEIRYAEYRKQERRRAAEESIQQKREVLEYGLKATILQVGVYGNHFKIGFGTTSGIKVGDVFQVFPPDMMANEVRQPIAQATVVSVTPGNSFLRVDDKFTSDPIANGQEAQRVMLED